jgi:hypothetical protein
VCRLTFWAACIWPRLSVGVHATTLTIEWVLAHRDQSASAVVLRVGSIRSALVAWYTAGRPSPAFPSTLSVSSGAVCGVGVSTNALRVIRTLVLALEAIRTALLISRPWLTIFTCIYYYKVTSEYRIIYSHKFNYFKH